MLSTKSHFHSHFPGLQVYAQISSYSWPLARGRWHFNFQLGFRSSPFVDDHRKHCHKRSSEPEGESWQRLIFQFVFVGKCLFRQRLDFLKRDEFSLLSITSHHHVSKMEPGFYEEEGRDPKPFALCSRDLKSKEGGDKKCKKHFDHPFRSFIMFPASFFGTVPPRLFCFRTQERH